jgi:hypothetical protein
MSKVRPLSPYMKNRKNSGDNDEQSVASGQNFLKYAINKKDPSQLAKQPAEDSNNTGGKDSPRIEGFDE